MLGPPDFWENYIDPKFCGRTPELVVDTDGKERLRIEGKIYGGGLGFAGAKRIFFIGVEKIPWDITKRTPGVLKPCRQIPTRLRFT